MSRVRAADQRDLVTEQILFSFHLTALQVSCLNALETNCQGNSRVSCS